MQTSLDSWLEVAPAQVKRLYHATSKLTYFKEHAQNLVNVQQKMVSVQQNLVNVQQNLVNVQQKMVNV
ncbi:MAG: hypothetical protein WCQ95_13910, partial [Bacteroidota bacterium]